MTQPGSDTPTDTPDDESGARSPREPVDQPGDSDGPTGENAESPGDSAGPLGDPDVPFDDVGVGLLEADMGPSSSLAHLYRGEIHRMKFWRERLDNTTRWAITIMAAILTWTFTSPSNPHYILLFVAAQLMVFAGIEAHRFRGYDVFRSRVRTLQRNVFARGLDPDGDPPESDWRERLADHYRTPRVYIPFEEALAHRLRRVYLPQLGIVLVAWVFRVTVYQPRPPWPASAAIGPLSGVVVTGFVAVFTLGLLVVTFRPRDWHAAREVAPNNRFWR